VDNRGPGQRLLEAGAGCSARVLVAAGLREGLLVRDGRGEDRDGPGDDGGRDELVDGGCVGLEELVVGSDGGDDGGVDTGTEELVDGVGVGLDELVDGVGVGVFVASSADLICWCWAIGSFRLPARKVSMNAFHVRPGMSLP
jgi:hypothetical protein